MIFTLFFGILFSVAQVNADVIEVNSLFIETEKTFGTNRGYFIPDTSIPKYHFNLGLEMTDGLGILYSDSKISSVVDQSQFRYIALDTEFGINTTLNFQIYVRHYSGHMLDAVSTENFPEENTVGLRFQLLD